jgi:DNA polymerase I
MPKEARSKLYLVDGSSYMFRAFHGIQHLSTRDGLPVNAVFGVTKMLLKLLRDEDPAHIAVVMDKGGKNFRHEMFPEYKANRPPVPEELKVQMPIVRRAIEALNLPMVELAGYEGDDIMATLAMQGVEEGLDVVVVSADKDLMQLVGDHVVMIDPMREAVYDRQGVIDKLGVPPERVPDWLGLMGDASDNIPGVSGVGEKTAAKLISEHGDLEGVLAAAKEMKKGKQRERLLEEAETARLSKRLATLCFEVPLLVGVKGLSRKEPDKETLNAFLSEMEFSSLREKLTPKKSIDTGRYQTVLSWKELEQVLKRIRTTGVCALDLETTSLDAVRAEIVGISLCPAEGEAYYIPVGHEGKDLPEQLPCQKVVEALRPILESNEVRLFGQNIKYDSILLANRHKLFLDSVACDSMVASYVLDPERPSHGLDNLAREYLHHETIRYEDVTGKGKQQIPFSKVPLDRATEYSGEDADVTFRLCQLLLPRLKQAQLESLFSEIELPLIPILRDLEIAGVKIDREKLSVMGAEIGGQMQALEKKIFQLAGREFNINSPAQLRVVLFDELGLEEKKKVKTGASTDSSVLEELALDHDLPMEILNYRSFSKLKTTYVDVLPERINPETGRVHTSFNQTVTATGRLSSSEPNLQNIPVRTELGRRIREAFVAEKGYLLLSADYSQVELRILAHVSGDESLVEAFLQGDDVHARTAARIFKVPLSKVTSEMRRRAKAVNFGIVYGQGPFNLARQLRLPRFEAKEIIENYLESYPRVAQWVESIHEQARKDRFVTTLFGRRRFLPDIASSNHNARANAERMAQNTPIQGTAADIIKKAMIDIHGELRNHRWKTRMVLQVHDELVFEVPEGEAAPLEKMVRQKMEGAAELVVPLTVDVSVGESWAEAH